MERWGIEPIDWLATDSDVVRSLDEKDSISTVQFLAFGIGNIAISLGCLVGTSLLIAKVVRK